MKNNIYILYALAFHLKYLYFILIKQFFINYKSNSNSILQIRLECNK